MLRAFFAAALAVACAAQSTRDTFDCAMRELAVEYAAFLQPLRNAQTFADVADALDGTPEKAKGCSVRSGEAVRGAMAAAAATSRFPLLNRAAKLPSIGGITVYVSTTGSDGNAGTIDAPFATLAAAVAATRLSPGFDVILLRAGTYYGVPTTVLTAADSGLTIQNFPGEEVWLSGAKPLVGVTWSAFDVNGTAPPPAPPAAWHLVENTNSINGAGNGAYHSTVGTYQECQAACESNGCTVWTWHDSNVGAPYTHQCFFDQAFAPVAENDHYTGYFGAPPAPLQQNVWSASLAGLGLGAGVPGLLLDGVRMTRARYPNNPSPERLGFMPPYVLRADSWTPQQLKRAPDTQVDLPKSALDRNTSTSSFQTYTAGVGGTCDRFQPNAGYWCSNNVQGGGSVIYYVPIAAQFSTKTLPNSPYANATGAVVQTWRPGHWASWMYVVGPGTTFDGTTTNMTFSSGGFQGSRGEDQGEDSFVENVFEELDYPTEWFYNETTQTLYFWHNATAGVPPPADGSLVVPQTKWFFNITGTMSAPVTDVSIIGLGMRDTAYTYMDPHSLPSGGDWSLERSAVVFVEGSERVTIEGNVFERVDGNAVILSAYNRNASIVYNEFAWIGATAVAFWGNTDDSAGADSVMPAGYGSDGTKGDQPRYNTVAYNLCRELGILEKQSSCYTQFKSGYNHIHSNIFYNGPRAHMNNNDGFAGGQLIENNLIFNSCRESGDREWKSRRGSLLSRTTPLTCPPFPFFRHSHPLPIQRRRPFQLV